MVVVAAAVSLAAQAGCQDDSHYPPGGGGGPSGGGGSGQVDAGPPDAGPDAGDGGQALTGQLCDLDDLRDPRSCSTGVNLSGIEVRAVGDDATDDTDSAGRFRLNGSFPNGQVLSFDGDGTRLALVRRSEWGVGTIQVPRVAQVAWADLIEDIGAKEPDDSATIVLYVLSLQDGNPLVGATVMAVSGTVIFYDDNSATGWSPSGATGAFGVALILSVTDQGTTQVTIDGVPFEVPVEPNHVTFARVSV
jgi:hypothetical protein